uniref:Uncharacterized protein n=1 Tax=viral metagenome TaxID=1070528 RepID=A0A6C0JZ15_9ZZZZ
MAFEKIQDYFIKVDNMHTNARNVAAELQKKYEDARYNLCIAFHSFHVITRLYASTSEVYIYKKGEYVDAVDAEICAYEALQDITEHYNRMSKISGIAKQAYNRAVKMRMEVFFKFRKLRT